MTTRVTVPRRSRRASNLASRVRIARTLLDCLSFRGAVPFAASEGREVESAHKGFDRVNVFKAGRSERNGTKYARRVVRDDNIPSRTRGGIEGEVFPYFPRWEPCAPTVELGMFRLIY